MTTENPWQKQGQTVLTAGFAHAYLRAFEQAGNRETESKFSFAGRGPRLCCQ